MEVDIKKRNRISNYSEEDKKLASKLAKAVDKELKGFVKAVVLFGSAAKQLADDKSDIDILIIVDDAETYITPELSQSYRVIVQKLAAEISMKFHINTLKLTNFWEQVLRGDPVLVNMLRDGLPLIDHGFFKAIQHLLDAGRIHPSKEAIWTYYARAPISLHNARKHLLQASVDLYWAAIDASHAALMCMSLVPPSPEHVPDMLEEHLVSKGLLHKKYPVMMRELYDLSKHISHRDLKEVSGKQYDFYMAETEELVAALKKIVQEHKP